MEGDKARINLKTGMGRMGICPETVCTGCSGIRPMGEAVVDLRRIKAEILPCRVDGEMLKVIYRRNG
jgi:hypothetical protein